MRKEPDQIYIKDYTYNLPAAKIAGHPLAERDSSRLLVYKSGKIIDDHFFNLQNHLPPFSSLIVNDTKVIEARLLFKKDTGGLIEIFCLEPAELDISIAMEQKGQVLWNCLIGGASKWKEGLVLEKKLYVNGVATTLFARYVKKLADSFIIEFSWQPPNASFADMVHEAGDIPLPPYIRRQAEEEDAERYQTVFAKRKGSVAAPTAALHFTPQSFERLRANHIDIGHVTLHVGAGTFKPVKSETIADHTMHAEHFEVDLPTLQKLKDAVEIIAVGTTSLRTLESLYWLGIKQMRDPQKENKELVLHQWDAYHIEESQVSYADSLNALIVYMHEHQLSHLYCCTSLLIIPGYQFRSATALITNFHQPNSTLLLLVAAFVGDNWKNIYQHALDNDYRFLSYGDSSLIWRKDVG